MSDLIAWVLVAIMLAPLVSEVLLLLTVACWLICDCCKKEPTP